MSLNSSSILHTSRLPVFKKTTAGTIMTRSIFVTIIILNILSRISANATAPAAPALYVFGDSIMDSGNNNLLPTLAKVDYQPYGMNFPAGATGRFTNGRTAADFIAEFLGLPYAPPYLSISGAIRRLDQSIGIDITQVLLRSDQLTGQNFASGTCGILPESGSAFGKCLNIVDQVNLFESIVHNDLPAYYRNSSQLSDYLSRSLYVISVGSNDYINNYLDRQNYTSGKVYTPETFAQLLVDRLSLQLRRLYSLGARKVIMFEIGPIGCIPSISRQFKHTGLCNEAINKLPVLFNNLLAPMLQNLTSTLHGSDFILGQVYKLSYDAVTNPSNYGLSDTTNPCCVALLNGTSVCIPGLGALACHDPEKHYFWDGYHPTETVYRTIASRCINDSSVCVPKSIKQLVQQV